MRKPEILDRLRAHLVRLGCPSARTERLLQEIGAHVDDAVRDGPAEGLSEPDAEHRALSKLGDPKLLAEHFMVSVRQASWCGRHRILTFGLLPAIGFFVWFMSWILVGCLVDEWFHLTGVGVRGAKPDLPLIKLGVFSAYYSGVVLVPVFFCWLARSRCCGWMAIWLVCASCMLHGLFQKLSFTQRTVAWGYGFAWPDWVNVAAPILIGSIAWWVHRRGVAAVGPSSRRLRRPDSAAVCVALALSVLLTGCAAHRPYHERGWIGGEYKLAKAPSPWSSGTVPAFPSQLQNTQAAGILVTALSSNAPAYLAGVRPGDLVLKVANQPVSKLNAFRRTIDRASPGRSLVITVFRGGQIVEPRVTVGREVYRNWHTVSIEIPKFAELDLWPNPSFSLVAIGYKREGRRTEIAAPETQFVRTYGPGAGDRTSAPEVNSPEGWSFWVPFLELNGSKWIVSQEATAVESR